MTKPPVKTKKVTKKEVDETIKMIEEKNERLLSFQSEINAVIEKYHGEFGFTIEQRVVIK